MRSRRVAPEEIENLVVKSPSASLVPLGKRDSFVFILVAKLSLSSFFGLLLNNTSDRDNVASECSSKFT